MSDALLLPENITLEYVAEGGANVIYRTQHQQPDSHKGHAIASPSQTSDVHSLPHLGGATSTPPPTEISPPPSPREEASVVSHDLLSSHLLRLHKAVPWLTSTREQFEAFDTIIRPLFPPEHLLSQYLVQVPSSIIAAGNEKLHEGEFRQTRPAEREGTYLAKDEQYGLLVEDMCSSSASPRNAVLVELKPKWLAQSPNAPKDAQRCRTCALSAMRRAKRKVRSPPKRNRSFCPLGLLSGDVKTIAEAVEAVLAAQPLEKVKYVDGTLKESLVRFFLDTSLLLRLRELQLLNDPMGILEFGREQPDRQFRLAMALRDCSLYLRARRGPRPSIDSLIIEGKLGDLDLKSSEPTKIAYWTDTERALREGGWYYVDNKSDETWTRCQLQRVAG